MLLTVISFRWIMARPARRSIWAWLSRPFALAMLHENFSPPLLFDLAGEDMLKVLRRWKCRGRF